MNTHVNFEIAKLLKEKGFMQGFDSNQKFYYPLTKELTENYRGDNYPAPTIAEVVMWLYEKHGIWIYTWNSEINMAFRVWIQNLRIKSNDTIEVPNIKICNSPTEAYEAAILYTLNNLI